MTRTLLSTFLLCCISFNALQANHIDFIVDGGFALTTSSDLGPASATQTGDPGNIIGGEREVSLNFNSGNGFLTTGILSVPAGSGPVGPDPSKVLLFDNSVSSAGTLTLIYDGAGSSGLGGLDFGTAWDQIDVTFSGVQGEGELTVTVDDTSTNSGALAQTINSAGVYSFDFSAPEYSGVDFTSVDSVQLDLRTSIDASDFAISQITREIVPEPSTGLLLPLGLLLLTFVRRK